MDETQFLKKLEASGHAGETLALIEKLGFTRAFVLKNVLNETSGVSVARVAMLWMGMPNKHDRKRTRQLLDALTQTGLLSFDAATETWKPR